MAVIQDLPPELLYRILELLCETEDPGDGTPSLLAASRVDQAWKQPAQALLPLDVSLQQPHDQITGYVAALSRLGWRPVLRRLALHGNMWETSETMERIAERVSGIERLYFLGRDTLDSETFTVNFLAVLQVTTLSVARQVFDPFRLGYTPCQAVELPLRHLILDHFSIIPRAKLSPLIDSAINLSHLSLAWTNDTDLPFFGLGTIKDWLKLAPRLRQLDLIHPPIVGFATGAAREDAAAVLPFLAACTRLQSITLSLDSYFNTNTVHLLGLISSKILVLRTRSDFVRHRLFEFARNDLRRAMAAPALEKLRRWELLDPVDLRDLGAGGNWWGAQCAERGIEILDGRHSIPDLPQFWRWPRYY